MSSAQLLVTVAQASKALNLGRTMTYRLIQTGELKSVLIGRSRRIPVRALEDFVARLEADDDSEPLS